VPSRSANDRFGTRIQNCAARDDEEAGKSARWTRVSAWFAGAITDVTTGARGSVIGTAATAFLAAHSPPTRTDDDGSHLVHIGPYVC
jgi:hypothetical protein